MRVKEIDRIDARISGRLKALRAENSWSLDELAARSGVSRATLSRLEKAEVSATANVLGRLCSAYGLTMSRLMNMVEDEFEPLVRGARQPAWRDPEKGFRRRSVSPPARLLAGEVLEVELDPGTTIAYETSPRPGLEHHLHLVSGRLRVEVDGKTHELIAGDTLRYRLAASSCFTAPSDIPARYFLFVV